MESSDYRVDKVALIEQVQQQALQKIEEVEAKCNMAPVAFLKSNFSNVKIRDRKTEPNIGVLFAVAWAKICGLSGIKSEIDDFVIEDITKMIFYAYSDLTVEEIYKAFELERYGVYENKTDHYQLFNAEYISTVLKKYKTWKHNIKTHHNITPDSKTNEEMSEEEKDKIVENGVNRFYEEYKTNKTIEDPSEYIFDHLIKKGLIKNNNNPKVLEYYQGHLQLAKTQLQKENAHSSSLDKADRQRLKIDLEQIVSGHSPKIILRAKKNILAEYFEAQIKSGKEKIF